MKIIVGLGNPGSKYANTRHNIGFLVVDTLLQHFEPLKHTVFDEMDDPSAVLKKQKKTFASVKIIEASQIILAKPQTYMNSSGFAVARLLSFYKISPIDLIIVHDDSDLPLGKIRVRFGGASGGHRGVQSIIETLGTDKFLRIRLGIGRPTDERLGKGKRHDLDRYVLAPFAGRDRNEIKHMLKESVKSIELILKHGIDTYMAKYNK